MNLRDAAFRVANTISDIEMRVFAIEAALAQLEIPAKPEGQVLGSETVKVPAWLLRAIRQYNAEIGVKIRGGV